MYRYRYPRRLNLASYPRYPLATRGLPYGDAANPPPAPLPSASPYLSLGNMGIPIPTPLPRLSALPPIPGDGPIPHATGSVGLTAASTRRNACLIALSIAPTRSLKSTNTFSTLTICSSKRSTRSFVIPEASACAGSTSAPETRTAWRPNW